jgi:hypothetical protein
MLNVLGMGFHGIVEVLLDLDFVDLGDNRAQQLLACPQLLGLINGWNGNFPVPLSHMSMLKHKSFQ